MIEITDYLKYIVSSDEPLSSNVFFVEGKDNVYIYDVGRNDEAFNEIEKINRNKTVIISHFHKDHIENIKRISFQNLYVSNYTYKHINEGIVVKDVINIEDGIKLQIMLISSVHSKGALVLNINNEYCLIGDSIFHNGSYNKSLTIMMIKQLELINTKYFVTGHEKKCFHEKGELIKSLKNIL